MKRAKATHKGTRLANVSRYANADLSQEEELLLHRLAEEYPNWLGLWDLLSTASTASRSWEVVRPAQAKMIAAFQRLKHAGRLVFSSKAGRVCTLAESEARLRGLLRPAADSPTDLGQQTAPRSDCQPSASAIESAPPVLLRW